MSSVEQDCHPKNKIKIIVLLLITLQTILKTYHNPFPQLLKLVIHHFELDEFFRTKLRRQTSHWIIRPTQ